jgi:DivIVA domain-containing protein
MDASQSALDSLRTVEFRETLKGYHRDDVDEYLEKAAVEAEGLQEQLRQGGERLRQAAERISQLEETLENQVVPPPPPPSPAPAVGDDALQRTLLLAQKFVDQTKSDSEAEASRVLSEAESKARAITGEAQSKAEQIVAQSEGRVREEIGRLEEKRTRLTNEVELMSRHLEGERARLRQALTEILKWVDANVHPEVGEESGRSRAGARSSQSSSTLPPAPSPPAPSPLAASAPPSGSASTAAGSGRPAGPSTPDAGPAPGAAPSASSGRDEGKGDEPERDGASASGSNRQSGAVRSSGNNATLPI